MYTFIFDNQFNSTTIINVNKDTTIEELINKYFKKKEKGNLIVNNLEETF